MSDSELSEAFGVEPATYADIIHALASDDPRQAVLEQFAALDALEDWALDEIRKWRHALAIAQATQVRPGSE